MRYALVNANTVTRFGRVEQYADLWNVIDGEDIIGFPSAAAVKDAGWLPVVETVAALGTNQHYGERVSTVRANDVLVHTPAVNDSPEDIAARTNQSELETALTVLNRLANGKTVTSNTTDRSTLAHVNAALSALAVIVRRDLRLTYGFQPGATD